MVDTFGEYIVKPLVTLTVGTTSDPLEGTVGDDYFPYDHSTMNVGLR